MALPLISGDECIRALARIGYERVHQKGSHVRLRCVGRAPVSVPAHPEIDRGTLRRILLTVGLSAQDFADLL